MVLTFLSTLLLRRTAPVVSLPPTLICPSTPFLALSKATLSLTPTLCAYGKPSSVTLQTVLRS